MDWLLNDLKIDAEIKRKLMKYWHKQKCAGFKRAWVCKHISEWCVKSYWQYFRHILLFKKMITPQHKKTTQTDWNIDDILSIWEKYEDAIAPANHTTTHISFSHSFLLRDDHLALLPTRGFLVWYWPDNQAPILYKKRGIDANWYAAMQSKVWKWSRIIVWTWF